MIDPMAALRSLQFEVSAGGIVFTNCDLYPELSVLVDEPNGALRFTYALLEGHKVIAVTLFVLTEGIGNIPCFQAGYAVVEHKRRKGLATEMFSKGMKELSNGLKRNGVSKFYIEAMVAASNIASNSLAARLISATPKPCQDVYSGEDSMQYLKLVD